MSSDNDSQYEHNYCPIIFSGWSVSHTIFIVATIPVTHTGSPDPPPVQATTPMQSTAWSRGKALKWSSAPGITGATARTRGATTAGGGARRGRWRGWSTGVASCCPALGCCVEEATLPSSTRRGSRLTAGAARWRGARPGWDLASCSWDRVGEGRTG